MAEIEQQFAGLVQVKYNIVDFKVKLITKKGEAKWVNIIANRIKNKFYHDQSLIAGSIIDISEQMEIQQHEKDLIQMKSDFVDMASHQFRTPLSVIYANMDLIEFQAKNLDKALSDKLNAVSLKVKSEVERMIGLMNNILLFGNCNTNEIKAELEAVDLSKLINEILAGYFGNLSKGRSVRKELHSLQSEVYVDKFLFAFIITTVVSNALKYSIGQADPKIAVIDTYPTYQIVVTDYGVGIPKEEQLKLFNSFYRASNVQTTTGTGLGLVITQQFIELHGGKIAINSKLNVGTEVIITLPYGNL